MFTLYTIHMEAFLPHSSTLFLSSLFFFKKETILKNILNMCNFPQHTQLGFSRVLNGVEHSVWKIACLHCALFDIGFWYGMLNFINHQTHKKPILNYVTSEWLWENISHVHIWTFFVYPSRRDIILKSPEVSRFQEKNFLC
jgi:hypothetical protein